MIGEIVVVFDWFKGRGLAEETEVVDWDWVREEGLYCYCLWSVFLFPLFGGVIGSKGVQAYRQAFLNPNEESE